MGTPMAVNFANLFMTKFESEMLRDLKQVTASVQHYGYVTSMIFFLSGQRMILL